MTRHGFRPTEFRSGERIPKHAALTFEARTDVTPALSSILADREHRHESRSCERRRGEISEGTLERDKLTRHESSRCRGDHTIEFFIVKGCRSCCRKRTVRRFRHLMKVARFTEVPFRLSEIEHVGCIWSFTAGSSHSAFDRWSI
jgi:hypothetical protein